MIPEYNKYLKYYLSNLVNAPKGKVAFKIWIWDSLEAAFKTWMWDSPNEDDLLWSESETEVEVNGTDHYLDVAIQLAKQFGLDDGKSTGIIWAMGQTPNSMPKAVKHHFGINGPELPNIKPQKDFSVLLAAGTNDHGHPYCMVAVRKSILTSNN